MTDQVVMEIGRNALTMALLLAGPMLGLALIVGLGVSVFQAVTQINEATLTFVPKILAILIVLMVMGSWMINQMVTYTSGLFGFLPQVAR